MDIYYVQIRHVNYFEKMYGIYAVAIYDEQKQIIALNDTIKGKSRLPLAPGRCYEIKAEKTIDKKNRTAYAFNCAFEVEPFDARTESVFLAEEKGRWRATAMIAHTNPNISTKNILKLLEERIEDDKIIKEITDYNVDFIDAQKLYEQDENILDIIKKDPYVLMDLGLNFTFKKCDKIASREKYNPETKMRIRSGIREILKEMCQESGDSYKIIGNELKLRAIELLNYYLEKEDIDRILEEYNKTNVNLIDYSVFDFFFNSIYIPELKQCIDNNEKYLFFEIEEKLIENELYLSDDKFLVRGNKIYLTELYKAEDNIVNFVKEVNKNKKNFNDMTEIEKSIESYEFKHCIKFNKEQKEAIERILEYNDGGFYILTGAAGTGKTTVVDAILNICKNKYIALAAPTGKAAKVLSNTLSFTHKAQTLHKLLDYNPRTNNFNFDKNCKLPQDFIVIDETSMLDLELCSKVFDAIENSSKVLFLGDVNQLPSIGPGRVLRDLIKIIPENVITLKEVCRQQKDSGIAENAKRILDEDIIESSTTKDNYALWSTNYQLVYKRIEQSIDYLTKKCKYNVDEIEVLTPMKMGIYGTYKLNKMLQNKLNPNRNSFIEIEEYNEDLKATRNKFRINDKVINMRNNYSIFKTEKPINSFNIDSYLWGCFNEKQFRDKIGGIKEIGVANGESGYIYDIFEAFIPLFDKRGHIVHTQLAKCVTVKFEEGYVCYIDTTDLRLGYAVTIHKSQGDSWKGVISLIQNGHQRMACNELIYVANTRARENNIYIGDKDIYLTGVQIHTSDRLSTIVEKYKKNI